MSKFVSVIPDVFVKVIEEVASSSPICAPCHRCDPPQRLDLKTRDLDFYTNLPTNKQVKANYVCLAASRHYSNRYVVVLYGLCI
jgi:hypothetical protein